MVAFVEASFVSSICMSDTTWGKLIGNNSHTEVGNDIESVSENGYVATGWEFH